MKNKKKLNIKKFLVAGIIFILLILFFYSNIKSNNFLKPITSTPEEFKNEIKNFSSFFINKNNSNFINKKTITVKPGNSLQGILAKEGIDQKEINKINSLLKQKIKLINLQVGQKINLLLKKENNKILLSRLSFSLNEITNVYLFENNEQNYNIKIINKILEKKNYLAKGVIKNSLYNSAQKQGVDPEIIIEFARIFGFEIDFQRDIRENDEFQILYERFEDDDGEVQKNGEIIFAYMNNNGKEISLYRFKDQKNNIGYYSKDGKSIEKALMKTPINGARLSSSFGLRKHPILGYNKLHQGTDFAAPKGTPVMASGSGTIEMASWNGAYGKYVRIRHNSTYKTAYAHLSRFGKKIRRGAKVQQGQIIGYVGSTGRSTGPHLHYEVLVQNKRVNSQRLKLPSGKNLAGKEMQIFENTKAQIEELRAKLLKEKTN
jgi:murein DD-endopeptidase MepM/ murein hydrolase activator NlpD